MELNNNTDIINSYGQQFANVNTKNRLIRQMVREVADEIRSFNLIFGSAVDKSVAQKMEGTYWTCITSADKVEYGEDVQIVTL